MIPDFGDAAPYIWAAYGVVVIGLLLLLGATVLSARKAKATLTRLEDANKEIAS